MAEIDCRHFNGYKPCAKNETCDRTRCSHFESVRQRVLIVHLEALGAVLRSTALIPAIKRKYPKSTITWVTKAPADQLLMGLPDVDRVLTTDASGLLSLSALQFDVGLVVDKSLQAAGVLSHTKVERVFGFRTNSFGAIVPANGEALELWNLGLNDQKKFFENKKSEAQLVHEALNLGEYRRDQYQVNLSVSEMAESFRRREKWSPEGTPIIGINTGASPTIPYKKMTVEGHRELIRLIQTDSRLKSSPIVLLGGREDSQRNREIAEDMRVISSPTEAGLRDGLVSVAACDLVFSGDSLGMHMAIGLNKWVVAWFGPTCAQEIDLFGRGVKVLTKAACSPCWRRQCEKSPMCYDQVDFHECVNALAMGLTSVEREIFQTVLEARS